MNSVKKFLKQSIPKTKKQKIIFGIASLLIVGLLGYFIYLNNNQEDMTSGVVTYSTDKPSEEKPGADYKWQGGPSDPKKIIIPSIGVDGYIQNVGVDQNKQVAVPNNIHIAGWFNEYVLPGAMGLSIIDGHVDGRQNDGIFKNLDKLNISDEYSIEFGNGTTKRFKVLSKQSLAVADSASVLFSQEPKVTSQLNLVTCGGNFNKKDRSYSERLIVTSELIDS